MGIEIQKAVAYITECHHSPLFGGSIALKALGLMDRDISDIDLVFPWVAKGEIDLFFIDPKAEFDGGESLDIEGVHRLPTKINKIKACCFYVPKNMLQSIPVTFEGMQINVQDPYWIIDAKISYSWHPKHEKDLFSIWEKLKDREDLPEAKKLLGGWIEKASQASSMIDELPF